MGAAGAGVTPKQGYYRGSSRRGPGEAVCRSMTEPGRYFAGCSAKRTARRPCRCSHFGRARLRPSLGSLSATTGVVAGLGVKAGPDVECARSRRPWWRELYLVSSRLRKPRRCRCWAPSPSEVEMILRATDLMAARTGLFRSSVAMGRPKSMERATY